MNQTLPPTEEHEQGDPEWLRQMRGWEDTPDWLRKLIRSSGQEPGLPEAASPAAGAAEADGSVAAGPAVDLTDLADAIASADAQEAASLELEQATDTPERSEDLPGTDEPGAPGTPILPPAQDEDVPPWLRATDIEESTAAEDAVDSALPPATEGDDIPDWLQRMSPAVEAETEGDMDTADGPPTPAMEAQDIPDWLRDLSPLSETEETDDRDVPEWLRELDQVAETDLADDLAEAIGPTVPEMPEEIPDEQETPEWLLEIAQTPEGEPGEDISGVPQEEGLTEGVRPTKEPEPTPAAEAEPEAEEPVEWARDMEAPALPEQEEFPDWLVDMAQQAPAQGAPSERDEGEPAGDLEAAQALPTMEDILGDGEAEDQPEVAEWLYAAQEEPPSEEQMLEFVEGELLQEEMPDWVGELRIDELAQEEKESPAETSGPLTGLRGLINPDPLFGLTPKATYTAMPPVPDAQQSEARLLRRFLAAPSKRPEIVSVSPGRAALSGLGRWLIYVGMLAAICVAIFVPALQKLIQPPQTVEAVAFYSAVNGLPQDSEVLLLVDYDASYDGELTPQTRAILWHLMNRDLGVIIASHTPQGAAIVEDLVRDGLLRPSGKVYVPGQHYLNLGYIPPHIASLQAFMAGPLRGVALWGASQAEIAQTSLGQRVTQFDDFDLILVISSNQEHVRWWVEQVATRNRQPRIAAGVSAAAATYLLPYYAGAEGRQIEGMLIGLAGAAEYEQLAGAQFWPNARENLILLGCAQLLLAAIVLASGIRSLVGRSKGT